MYHPSKKKKRKNLAQNTQVGELLSLSSVVICNFRTKRASAAYTHAKEWESRDFRPEFGFRFRVEAMEIMSLVKIKFHC